MTALRLLVWVCQVGPRVGSNALLGSLRGVFPGAAEHGAAFVTDGALVCGVNNAIEAELPTDRHLFVELRRIDQVAQAVSWAVASQTRFHSWQESRVAAPTYDRRSIDNGLAEIRRRTTLWREFLRGQPTGDVLRLTYEDDVLSDPRRAAGRVLEFCGVAGGAIETNVFPVESEIKVAWRRRWEAGE